MRVPTIGREDDRFKKRWARRQERLCPPYGLCLLQRRNLAHVHLSLCMPGIVSCLQAESDGWSVADQLADPRCTIGADGLLLFKDFVQVLAGNSEQPRDLGLRLAQRRHDVIKHRSWMRRTAIRVTPGFVRGH